MMADRELLRGLEFDFLAVDLNGHVAVLSSAGYGPIPVEVLDRVAIEDKRIAELATLPIVGESVSAPDADGDLSSWAKHSTRGIHCFDWDHWSGPYLAVLALRQPWSELFLVRLHQPIRF